MLRIGLTGGIGSGKSTVAAMLAALGAAVIDTDAIARQLAQPGGAAIPVIREAFGDEFIDATGGMDRERMRSLVFADASTRRRLEGILHPMIGIETERQSALSAAPVKVFDVPLLVESGHWRNRVDRVLVVDCSEATQIERVVQRPGWTVDAARAVIAQQASRDARRACADAVIVNDAITTGELAAEVRDLWDRWCALA
ncbi:dephospho-CoA kinase [Piscinibacter sp.]|uniref:dephospho-CoA kinase n=1 Tax=Piscinibacter sp. TaxID=1903157 RepID=UPI002F42D8EB